MAEKFGEQPEKAPEEKTEIEANFEKNKEIVLKKTRTSPEIFDILLKEGIASLPADRDESKIKQEWKEKGATEGDINTALQMMMCIHGLNCFVFGDTVPLNFVRKGSENVPDLAYIPPDEHGKEGYQVIVNGFSKKFEHEIEARHIKIEKNGKPIKYESRPTVSHEELFIGMAVHELRHRAQNQGKIKMFSPEDDLIYNGASYKSLFQLWKFYFQELRNILRKEGKSEKHIEDKTCQEEFDADLVEDFAIAKIHYEGISFEQLRKLINIQPETG